jgi:hypothetical protein
MFNETLTYNDGTDDHVYSTVITGDYKRVRRVADTELDRPELLTISHQVNEKTNISRSLVKFDTVVETAGGVKGNIRAHVVLEIPREVAVLADVTKVVAQLTAFLGVAGNVDKLINLES